MNERANERANELIERRKEQKWVLLFKNVVLM